ncbi:MAG: PBP1A family penicillin-binding protein [Deltaproteobacteria bacterium]|nr:PBP1A family penicillin-binding protein [Deltaproteobacteria bacterium]
MKKFFKITLWSTIGLAIVIALSVTVLWYLWSSNLPYIGSLREYNPSIITEIYSDDDQVIGRFSNEKRIVISLDQVPKHLIHAFVAAEDARFFEHEGVDIQSIFRAFIKNLKAGRAAQGGSTITQQVARDLLLKNAQKTYKRKVREAILSMQIEKNFSKDKILFLYINQPYMGHGAYGVEAAARTYFNKSALELNIAESALLAGLPQAPSKYSPISHFDKAKARQRYVLQRMREEGYISVQQEKDALENEIIIAKKEDNPFEKAPYFTEHIRRYLDQKYGADLLYGGGLKVYTTVNLNMQHAAQAAVTKGLLELDKREGYRGPLQILSGDQIDEFINESRKTFFENPIAIHSVVKGIVTHVDDEKNEVHVALGEDSGILPLMEMNWARKPNPEEPYYSVDIKRPSQVLRKGDVILCRIIGKIEDTESPYQWQVSLEQEPEVQGALLAMEMKTGWVKAMVGGRSYSVSQFNRAVQSRRQPGSAFKPLIYAAALDQGMTAASVILDAPYISSLDPKDEELWRPRNYKEQFFGPTLFRTALIKSRNVITVKILKEIGISTVISYARQMGIESDLSPDLSLALGSSGLSLLEITTTYSVFGNNGMLVQPIFINRIEDRTGQIIEENQPIVQEAIPEETAYIMTDLLKAVVSETGGTGWRAKEIERPAAGKTGTTNDLRDAWFIGYTPKLLAGVWVGYDDQKPMGSGETGSRAASPIWVYFMADILQSEPVEDFTVPEEVVFAKIDAENGLLASPYSKETVFQAFKKGTEPTEYAPMPKAAKSGQFSQFDMDFSQ